MLREAVGFMAVFAAVLFVAWAVALLPKAPPDPACEHVGTSTMPAGYELHNGVRFERAAYEVDILVCDDGIITVRK